MNETVVKLEGKKSKIWRKKTSKEIETLENTLHEAKSELQGHTEEANTRVKVSGAGQGRLCGVRATNVELKPWMRGETEGDLPDISILSLTPQGWQALTHLP